MKDPWNLDAHLESPAELLLGPYVVMKEKRQGREIS